MITVRVLVEYTDELKMLKVNDSLLESADIIQNKPIHEWFEPSNGRDGWKGLIEEIKEMLGDDSVDMAFEFIGPSESKRIFEECLSKAGYGNVFEELSQEEIANRNMEEAAKAEHRGFYAKAFQCYVKAANAGKLPEAEYKVAEYYYNHWKGTENGIDVQQSKAIEYALDYYERSAKQNYALAQFQLYKILSAGEGVIPDLREAASWLKKAANNKLVDAQAELGYCYNVGKNGIEKDETMALCYNQMAAENGSARAKNNLAVSYVRGIGVEQDKDKAMKLIKESAEQGWPNAQYHLGISYYKGDNVEKDYKKAVEWLKKSADQECGDAQYYLGKCYYYGNGVEKNYEVAMQWFEEAANQDNAWGQYYLGRCYYCGQGVEEDDEEAVKWFKKAAEQGNANAQYLLGECYYCGRGVDQNYEIAEKWFEEAAEQGHEKAAEAVASINNLPTSISEQKCYEIEEEEKDEEEKERFRKAVKSRSADDQYFVGTCYYDGHIVEQDYEKAIEWFKKAAYKGHVEAQSQLGECYFLGRGVAKNYEEAMRWCTLAIKQGDVIAKINLKILRNKFKDRKVCKEIDKLLERYGGLLR